MNDEQGPPLAYHELPGFDGYQFEDGWVAGVYPSDRQLVIVIDADLTETHPDFGPPLPGQMYRYRRVAVQFTNVTLLDWLEPPPLRGTQDPDGTVDYGHIDFFTRTGDLSHLGGEWGEVKVLSDMPVVELLESTESPRISRR